MTPEKKSESIVNLPPKLKKAIARGLVSLILTTGCNVLVDASVPERPIITLTSVPSKDPETAVDPTQVATELAPPGAVETVINPTPTYMVGVSGGEFTSTQDKLNQSEQAIVQQDRIQRWLDYWIKFDNRPFAEDSADIHWKYIYDNAKNPKEVWVLLEVGGEYNNKLFTVPMNENGFVDFPPTVVGSTIEAGLGPLEIDSNKDGTFLSVKDGVPVRINSEGKVVERLIQAQWEAVEKYPIDLEKLSTTPESYEYLLDHKDEFVKGPDPLEVGMEEFFKWYSEKLIPSLGDYKERDGNVYYNQLASGKERLAMSEYALDRSFKGQMEFWYFEHGGVVYPVLEIAGIKDGRIGYNIGVVLVEGFRPGPSVVIKGIKDGQKEFSGLTIFVVDKELMPVSEDVHKILEQGFFYYNGREHYFGIGTIGLWPIDY